MLIWTFIILVLTYGISFSIFMKYSATEKNDDIMQTKLAGLFCIIFFLLLGYIVFSCTYADVSKGAPTDSRIEEELEVEK